MKRFSITGAFRYVPVSLSISLLGVCMNVQAESSTQEDSVQTAYVAYLEEIINELEPDDADQLIDHLESLREIPVDINSAGKTELRSFPFLSNQDIEILIAERERRGRYEFVTDVYNVRGIDRERIHLLLNFIYASDRVIRGRRFVPNVSLRSHLSTEMHERRGYREGRYLGSPVTTYQRVLAGFTSSIHGGIMIAKSAGERSLTEHMSGYFSVGVFKDRVNLTVGDYRLHFGQGLLLGSGFGITKSGNPARGILRRSTGVRAAASRSGHYRYRGGALSVRLINSLDATVFYGITPRAATVQADGTIRTIVTYPVYRTETDLTRKNAVTERLLGAHIRQSFINDFSVGLTWYRLQYTHEVRPDIASRFSGRVNEHGSIDWSIRYNDIYIFGELATGFPPDRFALISGLIIPFSGTLDAALLYRSYPSVYTSMYGFPFAERRGVPDDERGMYVGLRLRPAPRHVVEGFFDVYSYSNNRRSPGLPSRGSDIAGRVVFPVGPASMLDSRIRRRSRAVSVVESIGGMDERIIIDRFQNNYRIYFITNPSPSIRIRMQYETVSVSYSSFMRRERGSYVAADVRWNVSDTILFNSRYILFGTESFDSRLYTAEYDMPGRVRTILLNGRGGSFSFGVQYKIVNNVSVSLKYNELYRSDGALIGSGFQEVDGPALGVIMVQIDGRI